MGNPGYTTQKGHSMKSCEEALHACIEEHIAYYQQLLTTHKDELKHGLSLDMVNTDVLRKVAHAQASIDALENLDNSLYADPLEEE